MKLLFASFIFVAITHSVFGGPAGKIPQEILYNRDIRPILSDACFHCHGQDENHRKGELRIDTAEGVRADLGGRFAIVSGDPDKSELFKRIVSHDEDEVMPPTDSHKNPLTKHQVALVRAWIEQGAEYQGHWAFTKPVKQVIEKGKGIQQEEGAIDHFVHKKLQEEGLEPSPRADKRTLIRRVSLDLTGLPPTIAEVNDFLQDSSPEAYNNLVDRLLRSGHYGEHRARYWLDAARYGDTHGLHFDNYREMWPYRDWVIDAYNKNLPFDEFTRDSLAGDMLPQATLAQKVASGFNRCNVTFTVKNEEFYVRYTIDRVKTTATVWMGLTMGCAQCHDHKYDPTTMKDFYQMFSFFNNITEKAETAAVGASKDPPPIVQVPNEDQVKQMNRIKQNAEQLESQMNERKKATHSEYESWLASNQKSPVQLKGLSKGLVFHMDFESPDLFGGVAAEGRIGKGLKVSEKTNGSISEELSLNKMLKFSYGVWIKLPKDKKSKFALSRMENKGGHELSIENETLTFRLAHSLPKNAIKVTSKKKLKSGSWQHVFVTYDGTAKAAGVKVFIDGKHAPLSIDHDSLKGAIPNGGSFRIAQSEGDTLLDDLRIYNEALNGNAVEMIFQQGRIFDLLAKSVKTLKEEELSEVNGFFMRIHDESYQKLFIQLKQNQQEKEKLNKTIPTTMVMKENETRVKFAYMLERGAFDKKADKVFSNTPDFLPAMAEGMPKNRLGLAQWLTSGDHPLTARVTVNRIWQEFFGSGIVETAEDFGIQGSWPSHPDLLDWLAVEFVESGWDVKSLIKSIVTSSTYCQLSNISSNGLEVDPSNRLLARGPRYRIDAETIRDQALFVSGLLKQKVGGPSVRPYQPEGLWKAVGFAGGSNTAKFVQDHGNGLYRRSLYTFWKRTSPPPGMSLFDAPTREECIVRRERTNTPLQALNLMNDTQYVEAARQLARRMLNEGGESVASKIRYGHLLCTSSPPKEEALVVLKESLQRFLIFYKDRPREAGQLVSVGESDKGTNVSDEELAAWTMLANTILNLNKIITKY